MTTFARPGQAQYGQPASMGFAYSPQAGGQFSQPGQGGTQQGYRGMAQPQPGGQQGGYSAYNPSQAQSSQQPSFGTAYNPQQPSPYPYGGQTQAPAFQFRATDFMGNQFNNPGDFTAQQGAMVQALNQQRSQQIGNMFTQGTPMGSLDPFAAYGQGQQMLQDGFQNPFAPPGMGQQPGQQPGGQFQDLFQQFGFAPPPGFMDALIRRLGGQQGGQTPMGQQPVQPPYMPFGQFKPGEELMDARGLPPPQPPGQAQPVQPPSQGTPYQPDETPAAPLFPGQGKNVKTKEPKVYPPEEARAIAWRNYQEAEAKKEQDRIRQSQTPEGLQKRLDDLYRAAGQVQDPVTKQWRGTGRPGKEDPAKRAAFNAAYSKAFQTQAKSMLRRPGEENNLSPVEKEIARMEAWKSLEGMGKKQMQAMTKSHSLLNSLNPEKARKEQERLDKQARKQTQKKR